MKSCPTQFGQKGKERWRVVEDGKVCLFVYILREARFYV